MRTYKSKAIQITSISMENPQFTIAELTSTIPMSKFYDVLFELAFVPNPCIGATCGVEIKMYLLITHIFASKQLSDQFDCHCHYKNILSLLQEKGYEAEFVPNQSMEALPKPHYFSANLTRKGKVKVSPNEIDLHKLLLILAQNNVSLSLLYTHRACAATISKSCYPIAQSVSSILGSNWGTTPLKIYVTHDNVQRSAYIISVMSNATRIPQVNMSQIPTLHLPFGTDLPLKVRHMPPAPKFLPADNVTADGTLAIGKVGKENFYLSKDNIALHTMLLGMSGMGKTVLLNNMMHELYKNNIHFVNIDLSTQAFRRVAPATISMVYTVDDSNVSPMDLNLFNVEGVDPKRTIGMAKTLLKNLLEEDFKAIHQFVDDAFDTFQGTSVLEFIKHALTTYDQNDYYQGELRSMRGSLEIRLNELKKLNNGYMFHLEKILKENTIIEFANVDEEKTRALYIYFILLNIWLQKKYSYNQSGIARPTVLFIDEVHRLLDTDNCKYAAMALKQLLKEILAEGRKFGLWLVLADQTFDIVSHFYYHSGTKVIFKSPYHDGMNDYFHTVKTYIPTLEKGKALIYTSEMEAPTPVELDAPHPEFTINMNDKDLMKHIHMNFKSIYDDQYTSSRAKKLLNDFRDMRKIYSALSFNRFVDGVKIPPSIEEEMKRLISQDPDLKNVCINT